jgi:hypothetical protein
MPARAQGALYCAPSDKAIPRNYGTRGMLKGSRSLNGREMTRIIVEGMLSGIGFVIGSAVVGWIFVHGSRILAFAIFIIMLWLIFRNDRYLKARLERAKIDKFTRALRSSAVDPPGISPQGPDQEMRTRATAETRSQR